MQSPVRLPTEALLEPDLALLQPRGDFYEDAYPESADILLVIEVNLSSLPFDREKKLPAYAKAGVLEVWLVDL